MLSQNGVGSTENDCVVKFSQLNPNSRRVWPFGRVFCLTFFREGCSPARRAAPADIDEKHMVHNKAVGSIFPRSGTLGKIFKNFSKGRVMIFGFSH